MTLISPIFNFPIIGEVLNLRVSTHAVYKAYNSFLLARTLFSYFREAKNSQILAKIKFSTTFPNLQYTCTFVPGKLAVTIWESGTICQSPFIEIGDSDSIPALFVI